MSDQSVKTGWQVLSEVLDSKGIDLYIDRIEEGEEAEKATIEYDGHLYQLSATGSMLGWSVTYNTVRHKDIVHSNRTVLGRYTKKELLEELMMREQS